MKRALGTRCRAIAPLTSTGSSASSADQAMVIGQGGGSSGASSSTVVRMSSAMVQARRSRVAEGLRGGEAFAVVGGVAEHHAPDGGRSEQLRHGERAAQPGVADRAADLAHALGLFGGAGGPGAGG
jgi:hypothetical protein